MLFRSFFPRLKTLNTNLIDPVFHLSLHTSTVPSLKSLRSYVETQFGYLCTQKNPKLMIATRQHVAFRQIKKRSPNKLRRARAATSHDRGRFACLLIVSACRRVLCGVERGAAPTIAQLKTTFNFIHVNGINVPFNPEREAIRCYDCTMIVQPISLKVTGDTIISRSYSNVARFFFLLPILSSFQHHHDAEQQETTD